MSLKNKPGEDKFLKEESQQGDSNPRPTDYESVALAN